MSGDQSAQARPEPKFDRFGRYVLPELLPGLQAGKQAARTRTTTFAKSVSDLFGLMRWQCRMTAKGVAVRPDLYALAAATPVDDKGVFDRLVEDAKEAAQASAGANSGSALHGFTQRVDAGEALDIPEPWDRDVAAYQEALSAAGIGVHPAWIERVIVNETFTLAGTFDRIVTAPAAGPVVFDLKTAKDLSYSWAEIAIQLAVYAHADAMWNGHENAYEPMPPVDRTRGLVAHLPVGRGRCTLHWVDLHAGWQAAQLCAEVRRWRTRRDLARPYEPPLSARIEAASSVEELVEIWQHADAEGRWSPDLTEAAKRRKTQLAA